MTATYTTTTPPDLEVVVTTDADATEAERVEEATRGNISYVVTVALEVLKPGTDETLITQGIITDALNAIDELFGDDAVADTGETTRLWNEVVQTVINQFGPEQLPGRVVDQGSASLAPERVREILSQAKMRLSIV